MLEQPTRLLASSGISPNILTVVGFLLNLGVALILALGWEFLGGFLVLFAGLFDMLDGSLARLTQRTSRFGALLDSVLDRFSEAALFLGLLWLYGFQQATLVVLLLFGALLGSIMVSYVRARAEGLGISCEVGLFARPERLFLLALGLIFSQLVVVLALLVVLTHVTVAQRMWHVWRSVRAEGEPRALERVGQEEEGSDPAAAAAQGKLKAKKTTLPLKDLGAG
jgi:CDP-diacylglycerol--glycerol-3-phosphate 3-phosphatidyltransferase